MLDILKQLQALKSTLAKSDKEFPATVFWNKALGTNEFQKIQSTLDFAIPEDVIAVYSNLNALAINWETRLPDAPHRTTYGICNIPKLDFLFQHEQIVVHKNKKSTLDHYWPDESTEEQIQKFRAYYVIDYLKTGEFVLIHPTQRAPKSQLIWYSTPDTFIELNCDFEEYIQRLLDAKAVYGWQMDLIPPEKRPRPYQIPNGVSTAPPYNHILQEKVAALKANPKVKKLKFEPNPGVRLSTLKRIKNTLGFDLPTDVLAFYHCINGFKLSWTWSDGPNTLEGSVDLLPLEQVFGGAGGHLTKSWSKPPIQAPVWKNVGNENPQLTAREVFPVCIEGIEGVSKDVWLYLSEGEVTLVLNEKGTSTVLPVSFKNYIEQMMATLGLKNWHNSLYQRDASLEKAMQLLFPASI